MNFYLTLRSYFFLLFMLFVVGCSESGDQVDPTVTDIDGNVYNYQKIGDQYWMTENLRTTSLNDGTPIENIVKNNEWVSNYEHPAYCWYDNNQDFDVPYGKLYNWLAVETTKLCPTGWHVPSDDEWIEFNYFLEGDGTSTVWPGDKIKETDPVYWDKGNIEATNETGFSALPAGFRHFQNANFYGLKLDGVWWTSTELPGAQGIYRSVSAESRILDRGSIYINSAYSVRCIKD